MPAVVPAVTTSIPDVISTGSANWITTGPAVGTAIVIAGTSTFGVPSRFCTVRVHVVPAPEQATTIVETYAVDPVTVVVVFDVIRLAAELCVRPERAPIFTSSRPPTSAAGSFADAPDSVASVAAPAGSGNAEAETGCVTDEPSTATGAARSCEFVSPEAALAIASAASCDTPEMIIR